MSPSLNRQQRRAQGWRGPLPEGVEPDGPKGQVDFTGVDFYAWRVGWATAHINPTHCVAAFMERPVAWGQEPMRKITRRALRLRALQLCVPCAQGFIEARMGAQYFAAQRQQRLDARGVTTYAALEGRRRRAS